jgi:hypothetical protein
MCTIGEATVAQNQLPSLKDSLTRGVLLDVLKIKALVSVWALMCCFSGFFLYLIDLIFNHKLAYTV